MTKNYSVLNSLISKPNENQQKLIYPNPLTFQMHQSAEQMDSNYLNKYISVSSPKFKAFNNPILKQLKKFISHQDGRLGQIQEGCSFLQSCILSIEEMVDKIQQRVNQLNQSRETQTISVLKNKQNQFIINELKDKIKKHQKNEQNLQIQSKHLKKQIQNFKRQSFASNTQEKFDLNRIKQELILKESSLRQKEELIQELNQKVVKLMGLKKQEDKKIVGNTEKIKREKQQEYKVLQNKLIQLEKQFDLKITSLHENVINKANIIEQLQEQLKNKQKQSEHKSKQHEGEINTLLKQLQIGATEQPSIGNNLSYTFNPAKQSAQIFNPPISSSSPHSSTLYQLELKLGQQQKLYKQLQSDYTSHLSSSNNLQIQLHQQIHQQKHLLQEQKKKNRAQKKKNIQSLQNLASFINKRSFNYFQASDIQTVIDQIKKIFTKQKQKTEKELAQAKLSEEISTTKINEIQKENRKIKNQNQMLKQQCQTLRQQIDKMNAQRQRQKQKKQKKQSSFIADSNKKKPSLNGSFGEISNPNSKSQTPSVFQQKYRQLIENLRSQIQAKQAHINQLQILQGIDFQKSKEKILSIQIELADTKNQSKKMQRERKQLTQTKQYLTKQIQSYKNTFNQFKQRYSKEKEQLKVQQQEKQKVYEQKICKLKEQNQSIDAKCQQKVMKYNKLKGRLQKLQLYNSQTDKRKDSQIEELIKKNQQLKMDCKLFEEKLNIIEGNITNNEGNSHNTPKQQTGYNRDLIEQIQMERDRILEQYQTKRRQNLKMKDANEKLDQERQKVQQQKNRLSEELQKATLKVASFQQNSSAFSSQLNEQKSKTQLSHKQIALLKEEKQKIQRQLLKLRQETQNKSKQQYQHLKKQLQSQLQGRKKLEKQQSTFVQRIKQLKQENQKIKKQQQQRQKNFIKQVQHRYAQKLKEKSHHYHEEVNKHKQQNQKKLKQFEQKLSEAAIREQNLINIINYKNQSPGQIRESMRCEEDINLGIQPGNAPESIKATGQENKEEKFQSHSTIIQKLDQSTNTSAIEIGLKLAFCQQFNLQIVPVNKAKNQPVFSVQKTNQVKIQCSPIQRNINLRQKLKRTCSTMFDDCSSNANIFSEEEQLLRYLKSTYPMVLQYLINSSTPYRTQQELTRTQPLQAVQIGTNTDDHNDSHQNQQLKRKKQKQPINKTKKEALFILEDELLGSFHQSQEQHHNQQYSNNISFKHVEQGADLIDDDQQAVSSPRIKFDLQSNKVEQINLFQNLKPSNFNLGIGEENIDDNFQICEEGQSINVGQTALNLQIKQIFNKLREQLQKVFNGEEISLSMVRILPRQLQDDYNELIAYIRQKIQEIKKQNQLSFIMAEVGDSPEQLQEELDNELKTFIDKRVSEDIFTYKKLIQEKQALLTSLINERTFQQNTINQMTMEKQELDEEHENRFMNQCNVYKKEVKQLKNKLDALEMNFQSLKNVFKNTMEIWVDPIENQDDLRDNFMIYKKVAKLTQLQSTRLNYYIFRYRQIKGISDD